MKNPISATWTGLRDLGKGRDIAPLAPDENVEGKIALVTGANRGLGKAVAGQLAWRGANVIMACRGAAPETVHDVARASGGGRVALRRLDLADLHQVAAFVDELAHEGAKIDLLVLNAGVVPREARPTAQGFELMFGVNYLANVLLVERALARGVLRTDARQRPRIVFVTSESHRDAGPIDLEGLGDFEPYGALGGLAVYGRSKLLLTVYAWDLMRRLGAGAGIYACCPGAVNTDIAREAPPWLRPALSTVMERWFRSPLDAAEPVLYLCCARALEQQTGKYLHVMQSKPPAVEALDARLGAQLFAASEALLVRTLGGPIGGKA